MKDTEDFDFDYDRDYDSDIEDIASMTGGEDDAWDAIDSYSYDPDDSDTGYYDHERWGN